MRESFGTKASLIDYLFRSYQREKIKLNSIYMQYKKQSTIGNKSIGMTGLGKALINVAKVSAKE